jgi:MFS family permease
LFSDSQEKIDSSFRFLLISRSARSMSLVFVTLAFSLYLNALGYSVIFIGLIYVLIVLFNMLFSLWLGFLGDRLGYSRILIFGEILPLFGLAGLTISTNVYVIVASAMMAGITGTAGGMRGAFSPGSTAFVASNWPNEVDRVSKLASMTVVASLSSIVGGLLLISHGYIMSSLGSINTFRLLFGVSSVLIFISLISLLFLKERRRPRKTSRVMKKKSFSFLLRIISANAVNGAGIGIAIPLLPLWFEIRYGISTSYVGEIFTVAYAATAIGSFLSGRYLNTARISAISVSATTRLFQGLLLVSIAFSPLATVALSIYALRSAVAGLGTPMRSAISVRGIGNEDYGTASSIQSVATRASQSTSGLSGYLMDVYLPSTLLIGGALQAAGSVVYYRLIRGWEKQNNKPGDTSMENASDHMGDRK